MRAHTLIVNGHVNSMISHDDLIALCRFISRDDFWSAMIEQVYVTKQHEYILVPRVGNHVVEFGKANDIERKFDDLKTLYKKGWDKHEWNVYKKVSLKFSGQIVCTRR
ncbi:MAG: cell division protein FtsQ, partial [Bacteroidales bacterium]|nr:cell division protein FtsQ [Bacteroidales bacterium]